MQAFARAGGQVITVGRRVESLAAVRNIPVGDTGRLVGGLARNKGVVSAGPSRTVGIAVHRRGERCVVHVVNYAYNPATHRIDPVDASYRLSFKADRVTTHSFPENPGLAALVRKDTLTLTGLGIYTIVEFRRPEEGAGAVSPPVSRRRGPDCPGRSV